MTEEYDAKKALMKMRQDSKCIRCPRLCMLHIKIMDLWYHKPCLGLRFWYFNDLSRPFLHHSLTISKPLLLHFHQLLVCSYPRPCCPLEILHCHIFFPFGHNLFPPQTPPFSTPLKWVFLPRQPWCSAVEPVAGSLQPLVSPDSLGGLESCLGQTWSLRTCF